LKKEFTKCFGKYKTKCVEAQVKNDEQRVKFAYIVFRSIDAVKLVEEAYKIGTCKRWLTMSFIGEKICRKRKEEL
jgi:hypothetical protein